MLKYKVLIDEPFSNVKKNSALPREMCYLSDKRASKVFGRKNNKPQLSILNFTAVKSQILQLNTLVYVQNI